MFEPDYSSPLNHFGIPRAYLLERLPIQSDLDHVRLVLSEHPSAAELEKRYDAQRAIVDGILFRDCKDEDGGVWGAQARQRNDDLLEAANISESLKCALSVRKELEKIVQETGRSVSWKVNDVRDAYVATTIGASSHLDLTLRSRVEAKWAGSPSWSAPKTLVGNPSRNSSGKGQAGGRKTAVGKRGTSTKKANRQTLTSKHPVQQRVVKKPAPQKTLSQKSQNASTAATGRVTRKSPRFVCEPASSSQHQQSPSLPHTDSSPTTTAKIVDSAAWSPSNILMQRYVNKGTSLSAIAPKKSSHLVGALYDGYRAKGRSFNEMEEMFKAPEKKEGTFEALVEAEATSLAEDRESVLREALIDEDAASSVLPPAPSSETSRKRKRPASEGSDASSSRIKRTATGAKRGEAKEDEMQGRKKLAAKRPKLSEATSSDHATSTRNTASAPLGQSMKGASVNDQSLKTTLFPEMKLLDEMIQEGYLDVMPLMTDFNDRNAKTGRPMKNMDAFQHLLDTLHASNTTL